MKELSRFYFLLYCSLDATTDYGSLGRLVNESRYFLNLRTKQLNIDGKPRLCLFALKSISPNEKIRYFYGDESVSWQADVSFVV